MVKTVSDFNLKETFTIEDPKASRILDALVFHDGEVKLGRLLSVVVGELKAMSRPTFYEKLKVLEREGLMHREARMVGNTPVAFIVLAEPYLGIIRQGSSDQFAMLKSKAVERLRALEVPDEEKEEILARLLKEYMDDSVDWILAVMREILQAKDLIGAVLAPSFSARYLFGWRLTTIGFLYWTFKAYGAGALVRVEEDLGNSREAVVSSVPGQTRGADTGES